MASEPARFRGAIMEVGPIPPSGGPFRKRYLDRNGRESLRVAEEEYATVRELLGSRAASMPMVHAPLVGSSFEVRRAIQNKKRSAWNTFRNAIDSATRDEIEPHIRRSESAAVAALNYLEDHELADVAHNAIHRSAFIRRGLFGCPITLRDDALWTECAFEMSHIRLGLSAGLLSEFECSVCGQPVEDCDHTMGETYDKVVVQDEAGKCSHCGSTDCEHAVGAVYPIRAYADARIVRTHEVSIVNRPRYPQSRFTAVTIEQSQLGDARFRVAAQLGRLNCDQCLGPCGGFSVAPPQNTGVTAR
ncbi:hypothetical protein C8K30_11716 [Promicromonospora sp. AC04]|nr:hypothetical protein C8K30_11716 [Promicromonospora sp. AC04]